MAIQAGGIELGLGLNTSGFNKSIAQANRSVQTFVGGVTSAGSSIGGFSKVLTGAGVAAGAMGYGLIKMGKAAFAVAADVAEMTVAIDAVGKSTGIGGAKINQAAKDIRKMGIEMKASQEIALLFVKGKLDLAKADDLARVAQDLAVISQSNSTDTAQLLTYAIQTGNSQLLKSAGITKYASEAYAQYARELKISQTALTASQRQQAVLNMILEEGTKVAGVYEAAMQQSGKVLRSFPRIINDIQLEFGGLFLDGFGPVILAAYKTLQAFSLLLREGGTLRPIIDALTQTFTVMIQPLTGIFNSMTESLKLFDGFSMSTQELADKFIAVTPLILSAGTALSLLAGKNILAGLPVIGKYASALGKGGPLGMGLAVLIATSPKLRGVFANILDGMKPMIPAFMEIGKAISNAMVLAGEVVGNLAIAFEGTLVASVTVAAGAFYLLAKGVLAVVTPILEFTSKIMENAQAVRVLGAIIAGVLVMRFAMIVSSMGGVVAAIMKTIVANNALGANFSLNMARMAIANTTGWAQIKGAMLMSLTTMKASLKAFSATLMTTFLPMLAIVAAVYVLMKVFTAWSSRNKDLNSTSKSLNQTLKDQIKILKGDEQAITDYVGAVGTLDRILLGAEDSGEKLSDAMKMIYGTTKGASDVLIGLKTDAKGTVSAMVALAGVTGEAASAITNIVTTYDKGDNVLVQLKRGYIDATGVTHQFTDSQIRSALAMEELQDQSENTDLKVLQENLVKTTILSSKNAKEAMKIVDGMVAEQKAAGNLSGAGEELAFVKENLSLQMQKIIDKGKLVKVGADGQTKSINNVRFAIDELILKQKEGELTADMFAKALLGDADAGVRLNEAFYNMQNDLGSLLGGIKAAKGNMHELTGVAFGLKDQLVANSQKLIDLGGNSADVAVMLQSVIDQFIASAEASGLSKDSIDKLLESAGLLDMLDSINIKITVDLQSALKAMEAFIALAKATGTFNMRQYESIEANLAAAQSASDMQAALGATTDSYKAYSKATGGASKDTATLKDATKALNEKIKDQKRAIVEARQALQDYARDSAKVLSASVSLTSVLGRMNASLELEKTQRAKAAEIAAQKVTDALALEKAATDAVKEANNSFVSSLASAVYGVMSLTDALGVQKSATQALTDAQKTQETAQSKANAASATSIDALATVASLEAEIASGAGGRRRKRELTEQLTKAQKDAADAAAILATAQTELQSAITDTNTAGTQQTTWLDQLEVQANKAKNFSSQIASLVNAGLSKDAIAQIAGAGADVGGEMAKSLLDGGATAITRANTLVDSIKGSAQSLTDAFAVQIEADKPVYEDVAVTVGETFAQSLAAQSVKAKAFTEKVKQLIAFGLRGTQLEEVINAGVDAGTDMADALLAAGETAIRDSVAISDELKALSIKFGDDLTPYFDQTGITLAEALLNALKEKLATLPKLLAGMSGKEIQDWIDNLGDTSATPASGGAGGSMASRIASSQAAAKSGLYGSFMSAVKALHPNYQLDPKTPVKNARIAFPQLYNAFKAAGLAHAKGGIVTSAQLGIVGEAGPEAIIPLSKMGDMMGGAPSTYNINVSAGMGANGAQIGAQIVEAIKKYEKSNGKRWRA